MAVKNAEKRVSITHVTDANMGVFHVIAPALYASGAEPHIGRLTKYRVVVLFVGD